MGVLLLEFSAPDLGKIAEKCFLWGLYVYRDVRARTPKRARKRTGVCLHAFACTGLRFLRSCLHMVRACVRSRASALVSSAFVRACIGCPHSPAPPLLYVREDEQYTSTHHPAITTPHHNPLMDAH